MKMKIKNKYQIEQKIYYIWKSSFLWQVLRNLVFVLKSYIIFKKSFNLMTLTMACGVNTTLFTPCEKLKLKP